MDKELKELMQINVVGENVELSNMVNDIVPNSMNIEETEEDVFKSFMEDFLKQEEIKDDSKNTFNLVVYKKENAIVKFFKEIKNALIKIGIIKNSNELEYAKNENKNN